jgi:hypothetical protein
MNRTNQFHEYDEKYRRQALETVSVCSVQNGTRCIFLALDLPGPASDISQITCGALRSDVTHTGVIVLYPQMQILPGYN